MSNGVSPSSTKQATCADCPANIGDSPNVKGRILGNTKIFKVSVRHV